MFSPAVERSWSGPGQNHYSILLITWNIDRSRRFDNRKSSISVHHLLATDFGFPLNRLRLRRRKISAFKTRIECETESRYPGGLHR